MKHAGAPIQSNHLTKPKHFRLWPAMKRKTLTQSPSAGLAEKLSAKPRPKQPEPTAKKAVARGKWKDKIGERFGRLTVLQVLKFSKIVCRCDCGKMHTTQASHLKTGGTRSCGCLRTEVATKHGHCTAKVGKYTKLYIAHRNMFDRCYGVRPQHKHYRRKGIQVCKRWSEGENSVSGFECFLQDMGDPPTRLHTVERINNAGHYEPTNCCWGTRMIQQNNRDNNIFLEALGQIRTLPEWSRITGVPQMVLRDRRRDGWDAAKALTTPVRKKAKNLR